MENQIEQRKIPTARNLTFTFGPGLYSLVRGGLGVSQVLEGGGATHPLPAHCSHGYCLFPVLTSETLEMMRVSERPAAATG